MVCANCWMPDKPSKAEYLRQWRLRNPDKCKVYSDKLNTIKRNLGTRRKGLSTPHLENSLGPPVEPTQKHVVLARLLRRLLMEAWDRAFLSVDNTHDDTEYEMRVKAALDVSGCLADEIRDSGDSSEG